MSGSVDSTERPPEGPVIPGNNTDPGIQGGNTDPVIQEDKTDSGIQEDNTDNVTQEDNTDPVIQKDNTDSGIQEDNTDNICCMCHDGGDLLSCDGPCRRSFHPTVDLAEEQGCQSLQMTEQEWQRYCDSEDLEYLCKNCEYKQHQCFECKELGSSSGEHENMTQVFQCASCPKFYHADCISIPEGETASFECPSHRCHAEECAGGGNLIPCRLCPKAWHEGCLAKDISFEEHDDGIPQRGWKLEDEDKHITTVFVFCHDHKLNRRKKPGYNTSLSILFPENPRSRLPDTESTPSRPVRRNPRRLGQLSPVNQANVESRVASATKKPPRQEVIKRVPPPTKTIKEDFAVKPKRPAIFLDPPDHAR